MRRLTDYDRSLMAAAIKDSFYEARDQGRTMHQAAEDERIFAAAEAIIERHRDEAWHRGANSRTDDSSWDVGPQPKRVDGVIGA